MTRTHRNRGGILTSLLLLGLVSRGATSISNSVPQSKGTTGSNYWSFITGRSNMTERYYLQAVPLDGTAECHNIGEMWPVSSERLKELLPEYDFFVVRTTRDFVHSSGFHTLGIAKGMMPLYLDSDEMCLDLLSSFHREVKDRAAAMFLLLAFADLRGYQLQTRQPRELLEARGMLSSRFETIPRNEWEITSQSEDNGWTFEVTVQTRQFFLVFLRYRISVAASGHIRAQRLREVYRGGFEE